MYFTISEKSEINHQTQIYEKSVIHNECLITK